VVGTKGCCRCRRCRGRGVEGTRDMGGCLFCIFYINRCVIDLSGRADVTKRLYIYI
jgi:hypothetical protein